MGIRHPVPYPGDRVCEWIERSTGKVVATDIVTGKDERWVNRLIRRRERQYPPATHYSRERPVTDAG